MSAADGLPEIHALWIGSRLGPVAAACIGSFARAGHEVVLHAYRDVEDLPACVRLSDASRVIPEKAIVRHRQSGSHALFSDIFRYELLRRQPVIYVDCDVYCVRPIEAAGYVMGYERDGIINGAVLALPSACAMLDDLDRAVGDRWFIPPWISRSKAARLRLRKLAGRRGLEDLPWGSLGPRALTYLAEKHAVAALAEPPDVFYPLDMDRTSLLFDPRLSLDDLVTPRTKCIHLYNEVLRRKGRAEIPPGSPLAAIVREAGLPA